MLNALREILGIAKWRLGNTLRTGPDTNPLERERRLRESRATIANLLAFIELNVQPTLFDWSDERDKARALPFSKRLRARESAHLPIEQWFARTQKLKLTAASLIEIIDEEISTMVRKPGKPSIRQVN
jgi:hypothetical protein